MNVQVWFRSCFCMWAPNYIKQKLYIYMVVINIEQKSIDNEKKYQSNMLMLSFEPMAYVSCWRLNYKLNRFDQIGWNLITCVNLTFPIKTLT